MNVGLWIGAQDLWEFTNKSLWFRSTCITEECTLCSTTWNFSDASWGRVANIRAVALMVGYRVHPPCTNWPLRYWLATMSWWCAFIWMAIFASDTKTSWQCWSGQASIFLARFTAWRLECDLKWLNVFDRNLQSEKYVNVLNVTKELL